MDDHTETAPSGAHAPHTGCDFPTGNTLRRLTGISRPLRDGFCMGAATLLATCLCIGVLYVEGSRALKQECRDGLVRTAQMAASLVDGNLHGTFVSAAQEHTAAYRQAVAPLSRILASRPDIRFLYTMVLRTNQAYVVLDATPPGDADRDGIEDHSPVMQPYNTPAPALLDALRTGLPQADLAPIRDRWGTYLSGYAPVRDDAGHAVGVAGVDLCISELDARLHVMQRSLGLGLLISLAVSGLTGFGAWWLHRRTLAAEQRRLETQQSLHDREVHYHVLMDALTDALFVYNATPEGAPWTLLDANEEACRRFGYTRGELLQMSPRDIVAPGSGSAGAPVLQGQMPGDSVLFEQVYVCRDGSHIPVEVRARLFMLRGQPVIISLVRDIRARKHLEDEQRKTREHLQHVQKLEGLALLAGGLAHDFNNLLTAILGNVDLAVASLPAGSSATTNLDQVRLISRRAADLCKQMLAYSGKSKFVVGPMDLSALVHEMTNLLRVSVPKNIALHCSFAQGLPTTEADATQLRQVVMNLVINASEAFGGRSGDISVATGTQLCGEDFLQTAYLGERWQPGLYVYVEVADTGCGMNEETQAHIFDPFFTTKAAGRGLGLAAVMGIVRGHKGAIQVSSEMNRGTTFRVLLPAAAQAVVPGQRPDQN